MSDSVTSVLIRERPLAIQKGPVLPLGEVELLNAVPAEVRLNGSQYQLLLGLTVDNMGEN